MLNAIFNIATKNNVVTDNPIKYLPPFRRCFELQTLTLRSAGVRIFDDTRESPSSLLMSPATKARSSPPAMAPGDARSPRYRKIPLLRPAKMISQGQVTIRWTSHRHLCFQFFKTLCFSEAARIDFRRSSKSSISLQRNHRPRYQSVTFVP